MAVTSNKRYFLAIVLALACNTAQAQMNSLNELEVKSNIATNSPTHTDMDLQGIAPLADTSCKSYVSSPEQDMNSKKRDLAQSDEASIRDSTVSESNQVNEQNCDNDEKFDIFIQAYEILKPVLIGLWMFYICSLVLIWLISVEKTMEFGKCWGLIDVTFTWALVAVSCFDGTYRFQVQAFVCFAISFTSIMIDGRHDSS